MDSATLRIWHTERKTETITVYYVILASETATASLIITYDAAKSAATCDVYTPIEHDYTVHDFCNHDRNHCVLGDPESVEFAEVALFNAHADALAGLEAQVKQSKIAEQLLADKAKCGLDPNDVEIDD